MGSLSVESMVRLSNGVKMPLFGYGTSHNGGWSDDACKTAVELGVKLYDTAARYGTEGDLSRVLRQCNKSPEDVFITTKLWHGDSHDVPGAFRQSLSELSMESVDLYLVHWPGVNVHSDNPRVVQEKRAGIWREMEKIYDSGRARAIGVSNFLERHLSPLLETCSVPPMVNQIEFNAAQNPTDLLAYCRTNDIVVEGYCPLAKGHLLNNQHVVAIAKKHSRTPSQVLLRWCLQQGVVSIPKSTKSKNVRDNIASLDSGWGLDTDDMDTLSGMHQDLRVTWDPSSIP